MDSFNINKRVNPRGLERDEYDAIIIGAGIGGLTCGCYLAKAGMKVLIVEQHNKPGGYCTSFKRNGFTFDAGIHSLVSCREDGQLGSIINELGVNKKIELVRSDPSDIIITPYNRIAIKNDFFETLDNLCECFPHQADEIRTFFELIKATDFLSLYGRFRNKTFRDVLDEYFENARLKSLLGALLGNLGMPSTQVSALAAIVLYREHLFDGGYYPKGGMQALPNALTKCLKEYGGEILFSSKAEKIVTKNGKVEGIVANGDLFGSKYVISNCDARQTYFKLIGKRNLNEKFIEGLERLTPSISAFLVFLGIGIPLHDLIQRCAGLWYLPSENTDHVWEAMQKRACTDGLLCMFPSFHDKSLAPRGSEALTLLTTVPFKTKKYWENNKLILAENIIKKGEEIIPNLSKHIVVREIATPFTLYRYTLNSNGAIRGWQASLSQTTSDALPWRSVIKGLFIAGHWTTTPAGQGGISMVAYSGKIVAKSILNETGDKN